MKHLNERERNHIFTALMESAEEDRKKLVDINLAKNTGTNALSNALVRNALRESAAESERLAKMINEASSVVLYEGDADRDE